MGGPYEVDIERCERSDPVLGDRGGPGAGRPSQQYRRAARDIAVSLAAAVYRPAEDGR